MTVMTMSVSAAVRQRGQIAQDHSWKVAQGMWKKVVAPTVLVSMLWVAVSGATTYYIHWLTENHARILTENVSTIHAAAKLQEALWKVHAEFLADAQSTRSSSADRWNALEGNFMAALAEAEATETTTREHELVIEIRDRFFRYRDYVRQRAVAAGSDSRRSNSPDEATRLALAVVEPCQDLLKFNQQLIAASRNSPKHLETYIGVIRPVTIIAGPAIGILFGVWVARGLHQSISRISVTLKDATSELEQEVGRVRVFGTAKPGDLPELDQQVQQISTRIRDVVDELHAARRDALRSERLAAVGELAAGVAHELRNPLTSVKLLIQTAARRQTADSLGERQLLVVQEEIARMENTIQGLLDFARPPKLKRLQHDVRETVRRALNLVAGRAGQQGVRVFESFPPDPVRLEGDPEQLHQVFVNLLLNGIESMPGGGELHVLIEPEGPAACRIVFQDSGTGIPSPILDRLFEPFVTSKERGTGLGLAISQRIVQEHFGTLDASNLSSGGASFTVKLPFGSATDTPTNEQAQVDPQPVLSATA